MGDPVGQAESPEQGLRPLVRLPAGRPFHQLRDDDVLERGEIGEEMMELVDEAQCVPAHPGSVAVAKLRHFLAGDPDRAFEAAF